MAPQISAVTDLSYFLLPVSIIFSIITVYLVFNLFKSSAKSVHRRRLPPGPKPWPIVGNIPQLASAASPHVSLFNLSKIHGPLMYLMLGTQPLIVASSPESAREILKSKDRIFSGRHVPRSVPFAQSRLNRTSFAWTEDCNDYWKLVRTICRAELFSSKAIESQAELREENISELIRFLRGRENRVLKVSKIVFALVFNILGNAMMSRSFINWEEAEEINVGDGSIKAVSRELTELLASPNLSEYFPIFSRFDVQGLKKKLRSVYARLRGVWEPVIDERRKARANDDDGSSYSRCHDFLDALLDNDLSNDQITMLFTEMFVAGSDTTTSTIEWTLAELLKNPELRRKVREEIDREINQEFPKNSHHLLNKLPYLQACLKETLRLHPPAPLLLPHRAIEECQVMSYTVPKDAQLLVNAWAIGRDPCSWVDPSEYDPERFMKMGIDFKGSDFEFLPFGSGRRICPGMPMVARNVPLILAALIHFFDWVIPLGYEIDMSEKFGITMEMEHPLMLIPKSRREWIE